MGQYYKPCIIDDMTDLPIAWMYSHDYGSGLKLMEHSWMCNDFVVTFEMLLTPGGEHHMSKVVWAGDYAEGRHDMGEDSVFDNDYDMCADMDDAKERGIECNIIGPVNPFKDLRDWEHKKAINAFHAEFPFIVNHTKKMYVDKRTVHEGDDGWRIHPLPLLTADGSGRGGGDYRGEDPGGLIGSWARDVISVESEAPGDYAPLHFNLIEN